VALAWRRAQVRDPNTLTLPASSQKALLATDIFGSGIQREKGWIAVDTSTPAVRGFFLLFDSQLTYIDGSELIRDRASQLVFPRISADTSPTQLALVNTSGAPIHTVISLYANGGQQPIGSPTSVDLRAFSGFSGAVTDLASVPSGFQGYAVVNSTDGDGAPAEVLIGLETYRRISDIAVIRALPETAILRNGYFPHLASEGGWSTTLTMVNSSSQAQVVQITADGLQGPTSPVTVQRTIPPFARLEETAESMFNLSGPNLITGYIRFELLRRRWLLFFPITMGEVA
jgi:hypothetical protein